MRAGLQKVGRWAAGRLQGSKGVQKYDKYMAENAAVRNLLTAGDVIGAGALGYGLVKGVGAPLVGKLGSAVKSAGGVGKFATQNKDLIAMAGKGIGSMLPDPANEAALMNAETQRMRFEEEQRQLGLEQERRRRVAEMLMPMARQNFPGYFGNS